MFTFVCLSVDKVSTSHATGSRFQHAEKLQFAGVIGVLIHPLILIYVAPFFTFKIFCVCSILVQEHIKNDN